MKQGDALSPLLFNFALKKEYAIRRVQVNQDGLKLNGTHQLLNYADDVNILGGSVHTVKKNAPTMLLAGGRQHRRCIIPQAVTYSLVLLKMGKIISRNMLS